MADFLINKDSISYFLNNCPLLIIYEGWILFLIQPLVHNNNIEKPIIAALDIVQGLLKGSRIHRKGQ
jgi:hypothetical protein